MLAPDHKCLNLIINPEISVPIPASKRTKIVGCIFRVIEIKTEQSKAVRNITILGSDKIVSFKREKNSIFINMPQLNYNDLPCSYAWVLKIETE